MLMEIKSTEGKAVLIRIAKWCVKRAFSKTFNHVFEFVGNISFDNAWKLKRFVVYEFWMV